MATQASQPRQAPVDLVTGRLCIPVGSLLVFQLEEQTVVTIPLASKECILVQCHRFFFLKTLPDSFLVLGFRARWVSACQY